MTNPRATSESVLALFAIDGHRFSAHNLGYCRAPRRQAAPSRPPPRSADDGTSRHSSARLAEFDSQALANTAWAFATAGVEAHAFFNAIADAARPRLAEFDSQALANTAWAFATAGVEELDLFDAVADAARPQLGKFNSQSLANTAWAFATARIEARDLFVAVAGADRSRLGKFNSQNLANTRLAFECHIVGHGPKIPPPDNLFS